MIVKRKDVHFNELKTAVINAYPVPQYKKFSALNMYN